MSNRDDQVVKYNLGFETNPPPPGDTAVYAAAGEINDGVYVGAGLIHITDGKNELNGPNAGFGTQWSGTEGARVIAKAELASASASVGPVKGTVGLSADTGVGVGPSGVEAKVLGTGFSIGREVGFSVLGSGFKFKLW